jgi:hypothetical protein
VHAAPPVRVTLGRSAGWVIFNAFVAGAAAANVLAWGLLHLERSALPALWVGAAVSVAAARLAWRSGARVDLTWDGSSWQYAGQEGDVKPMLDLDGWLLLRFDPVAGRRCWIAASRRSSQGPWAALRAALYSSRPASDPPGPQQP